MPPARIDHLDSPAAYVAYTDRIARRVLGIVGTFYPRLDESEVSHILCEALCQIGRDVRAGSPAYLEYLGELRRVELPDGPVVRLRALEPEDELESETETAEVTP